MPLLGRAREVVPKLMRSLLGLALLPTEGRPSGGVSPWEVLGPPPWGVLGPLAVSNPLVMPVTSLAVGPAVQH